MSFPKDFLWGFAAASYQIEGAAYEDGKGLNTWDVFCRKEGAVSGGHSGDVACDHYHRWKEDLALMKQLNTKAYRLSINWARVLPEGEGRVNEKGMAFYEKLVDELLALGITPMISLFHWDYPHALFCRGGWLSPESPAWFAKYAALVTSRLGDRVKLWLTHNEPSCVTHMGHWNGTHAPGLKLSRAEVLRVAHNILLSHGRAVQEVRKNVPGARVGIVPAAASYIPNTGSPDDIEAARQLTFSIQEHAPLFSYTWWLDPVYRGHYPEDGLKFFGKDAPEVKPGEMELINQKIDFHADNYYFSEHRVAAGQDGKPVKLPQLPGYAQTTQGDFPITPEGMYWRCKWLYERYGHPVIITENGHQNNDYVMLDGKVHDPARIDYTRHHLLMIRRAISEGIPVLGYLHWTFMDNFEWALGYRIRVGMVYTDYQTLKRTPKDSAAWYSKVMASNGASLDENPF
jgi:beta-glucosidase